MKNYITPQKETELLAFAFGAFFGMIAIVGVIAFVLDYVSRHL